MSTVIVVLIVIAVVLISAYAVLGRRRGRVPPRTEDVAEPGVPPEIKADEAAGDDPPRHSSGPEAPERT